jgi:hypothetical protein
MKRLAIALSLFATVFTTSSFASDGIVAPEVLKSFQTTFATAKDINWSVTEELYKVHFTMNGQHITAFYKMDGMMAALTRNITVMQLPVNLQTSLKNEYSNYWVSDLFEVSSEEGTQYYVTLENADVKLIMKSAAASWTTYQKDRKN